MCSFNKEQSATWNGDNTYFPRHCYFSPPSPLTTRPHRKPNKTNNKKLRPTLSEFQVCNLHAADQSPLSGSSWCPNNGRILFVEISLRNYWHVCPNPFRDKATLERHYSANVCLTNCEVVVDRENSNNGSEMNEKIYENIGERITWSWLWVNWTYHK